MRRRLLLALWIWIAWAAAAPTHVHAAEPHRVSGDEWLAKAKKKPQKKREKAGKRGKDNAAEKPAEAPPAPVMPEPRPLPKNYRAVALLPLIGIDTTDALLHDVEVALLSEIDETQGMRAISPNDVENDLRGAGLSSACDGELLCLARAGRYAGAHVAIETRLAAIGGTLSISLRLIDTQAQSELNRVAEPISENETERATELHRLAVQLLKPDTYVGTLVIQCSEPGADIYLDDKLLGPAPLKKPVKGLRAGPHILRVSKSGFADLHQFVDVVYKRTSTIKVDLSTTTISGVITAESQSLGALYIKTDVPGIEIRVDGEPIAMTPLDGPIQNIPAGARRISLRKEGQEPVVQEITVEAGMRTDLEVSAGPDGRIKATLVGNVILASPLPGEAAPALAPGSGPTPPPHSPWRLYAGIGLGGVGALALLASPFLALRVRGLNQDAEVQTEGLRSLGNGEYACSTTTRADCVARIDALSDLRERASGAERTQWVALVGGTLLTAAGAGLLWWELFHEPTTEAAPVEVEFSAEGLLLPGGAGLQLRLGY